MHTINCSARTHNQISQSKSQKQHKPSTNQNNNWYKSSNSLPNCWLKVKCQQLIKPNCNSMDYTNSLQLEIATHLSQLYISLSIRVNGMLGMDKKELAKVMPWKNILLCLLKLMLIFRRKCRRCCKGSTLRSKKCSTINMWRWRMWVWRWCSKQITVDRTVTPISKWLKKEKTSLLLIMICFCRSIIVLRYIPCTSQSIKREKILFLVFWSCWVCSKYWRWRMKRALLFWNTLSWLIIRRFCKWLGISYRNHDCVTSILAISLIQSETILYWWAPVIIWTACCH